MTGSDGPAAARLAQSVRDTVTDNDLKVKRNLTIDDAPTRTVNGATRGSHSASDSSTEHAPRAAPR